MIDPIRSDLAGWIALARGEAPADLLISGCKLVNVLSGEVHETSVAVARGHVIGVGEQASEREVERVVEARGAWLCPGLIDGHIHMESTLLAPEHLARVLAAHGTAALICDPHEIANVLGLAGVHWALEATAALPVGFYFMAPSCVPATHMETAGACLDADDLAGLWRDYPDRVLGLAEMMNFPGVLFRDPGVLAKLAAAGARPIDGHAPLVSGRDLDAYILAGPSSDHESTRLAEACEKLRKGMHLFLREGTAEHNLLDLLPVVNEANAQNLSFASDDRHPEDLVRQGHMDHSIRLAVAAGLDPVRAVQMASINTARHYDLARRGAVAPGFRADFVLLDDLSEFRIRQAFLRGVPVDELDFSMQGASPVATPGNSVHLPAGFGPESLRIAKPEGKDRVRTIGIIKGQIITEKLVLQVKVEEDVACADPQRNLAKLAVVERHTGSGRIGLGFVQGLGLRRGALASTVAHDSHNLILAGCDDTDMVLAARRAAELGGGFVAVADGKVLGELALPIAGLMSREPLEAVLAGFAALESAWRELGVPSEAGNPLMALSFLALPVIPHLKLTDQGLVDVDQFSFCELWV